MREIIRKKQFKKDYQSIKRTGRNMARLVEALDFLQSGEDLPSGLQRALQKLVREGKATDFLIPQEAKPHPVWKMFNPSRDPFWN